MLICPDAIRFALSCCKPETQVHHRNFGCICICGMAGRTQLLHIYAQLVAAAYVLWPTMHVPG
jgi:hypothetical protein